MTGDPLLAVARQIRRPSYIYTAGGEAQLEAFDDLEELAARVASLADGATDLVISHRAWPAAYPGLDLFFAWSIYRRTPAGAQDWIGSAAILDAPREALQAALDTALGRRAAA